MQRREGGMGRLDDKVAIVTGAGQGVGRGIALALAKEGASVVVAGRTLEKCVRTCEEIQAAGGVAIPVACEISNRDEVEATVAKTLESFGALHVLVNNAQASRPLVPFERVRDRDIELSLQAAYGAFYFMQTCFPHLQSSRGCVVNVGSVAATRGDAGFTAYAMAKEAIRGMSRVAAREWGQYGVTVNVICPFSESPGIEWMIKRDPNYIHELTDSTSMKRLGSSENDVGRTVVFLASADASYITGQTINVDGGIWIAP
jgi:NAD(P)-dependent dehydrogenase (short-subunit alcohol dehydrogenase family)